MRTVELIRTMGAVTVTARTTRANNAWTVAMLVEVTVDGPYRFQRQYFESAEAAKNAVRRWTA